MVQDDNSAPLLARLQLPDSAKIPHIMNEPVQPLVRHGQHREHAALLHAEAWRHVMVAA
jgi:hypothetical protein